MIKIRLQFSKTGPLRYIGHLDFLKVFQQTIRRAKLPMVYSKGFNPHMQLSFALPLPLGMTSVNDYADIVIEHDLSGDEIISRFNAHAPNGLTLSKAWPFDGPGAAALAVSADYLLTEKVDAEAIKSLLSQETLVIPKKTKSGIKDTDIRPDIFDISTTEEGVAMSLAAGSGRFLNPLIVAKLLIGHDIPTSSLIRQELYRMDNTKGLIPLYEAPIF